MSKKPTESIKVLRGIECPARPRYPFATMKVGECFIVATNRTRISAAASWAGKRYKRTFAVRKMPDGKIGCWRVK